MTARLLYIRLLGGCTISAAGQPDLKVSARKGRALLAYLAMAPRMQAGREQLAALLWDDSTEAQARQSLRQTLIVLRKDLGSFSAALLSTPDTVALDAKLVRVDALEFEEDLAAGNDAAAIERSPALDHSLFLQDFNIESESFIAWMNRQRERLGRMATRAAEIQIERLDVEGKGRQAIEVAESLVARDALREDWQRLLLTLYARYNCREVALSHADELVTHLREELGAEPEPATKALIESILRNKLSPAQAVVLPSHDAAGAHPEAGAAIKPPGQERTQLTAVFAGLFRGDGRGRTAIVLSGVALCVSLMAVGIHWLSREGQPAQTIAAASEANAAKIPTTGPADFAPLTVTVQPVHVPASADLSERRFADELDKHLADRLSQFSDLSVVPAGPDAQARALYSAGLDIDGYGGAIKITVRLIDNSNGHWSVVDEIEGIRPTGEPEQFARRFARQLDTRIYATEAQKPDSEIHGGMLLIKGRAAVDRGIGRENDAESRRYLEEALRINPNSTRAMVGVAKALLEDSFYYVDVDVNLDRIEHLLTIAAQKEPNAEYVHYWIGNLHNRKGQYALALESHRRVVELNPSFASAYAQIGFMLTKLGHPEQALDKIDYAIWLSPNDAYMGNWLTFKARTDLSLGNDRAAIESLQKATTRFPAAPRTYGLLAAANAFLGNTQAAADFAAKFQKLAGPHAADTFTQEFVGRRFSDHPELLRRLQDAFNQASGIEPAKSTQNAL
jgi:DNA-binding SARP family transcriptional activator/Tfp pilus assembly protein PilF